MPPLHAPGGSYDIVVLKLNSAGVYQWHTFYGSAETDFGNGIAVDSSDNILVTGKSAATWNGDGYVPPLYAHSGYSDIVVLKLNSAGAYQWHTFYGAVTIDTGYSIAVDDSGNVWVAGTSLATWNGDSGAGPLHEYGGSGENIVVFQLDPSGLYQWHTFYGSSDSGGYVYGYGIAVDGSRNTLVTGYSGATWNGDDETEPLHPYGGSDDIVVLKLAEVIDYSVTVNATGTGTGHVNGNSGNASAISYDYPTTTSGSADFHQGATLILTATANAGSTASWSGTCTAAGGEEAGNGSTVATCTFSTLDAEKTVTATFTLTQGCGPDLKGGWQYLLSKRIWTRYLTEGVVRIHNGGNRNAGAFRVTFYLSSDGVTLGPVLSSNWVWSLKAGAATNLKFGYFSKVPLSGQYIMAVLDSGNSVAERDETNNRVVKQIP